MLNAALMMLAATIRDSISHLCPELNNVLSHRISLELKRFFPFFPLYFFHLTPFFFL